MTIATATPTANAVVKALGTGLIDPGWLPASSPGFTWTEVTGTTQTMVAANGYIANNVGLVTFTLPATATVGDVFRISGKGAGGWLIAQNASGQIHFGNTDTTSGVTGSIASTHRRDAIELVCCVANNEYNAVSSVGVLTVA